MLHYAAPYTASCTQEEDERKMEVLKQALDKSTMDAERVKQEKRLQRLQNGGHDTSRLQSHYQGRVAPPTLYSTL